MVIENLKSLSFELFLTGSRFFGNTHSESDWDFYTADLTSDQEEELYSLGFTKEDKSPSDLFGGCILVYAHPDDVHILIVKDVLNRHLTQQTVAEFFPNGYSNKSDNAKAIWKMAECIVDLRSICYD